MFPQRGDVVWVRSRFIEITTDDALANEGAEEATEKARPFVIVSRDELNRGNSVLGVPFYSQQVDMRKAMAFCVFFPAGTSGLPKDCVAKADQIASISVTDILWKRGRIGRLNAKAMEQVVRAIRYAIRDSSLK